MPDFTTHFKMAIESHGGSYNAATLTDVLVDKEQKLLCFDVDGHGLIVSLNKLEELIARAKLVINMGSIHALTASEDKDHCLTSSPGVTQYRVD